MRSCRWLPLALALCLLLPAALAAVEACAMAACGMAATTGHECCPEPEARVESTCCDHDGTAATAPAPARERAPSPLGVHPSGASLAVAPQPTVAAAAPEPTSSSPRDLLARHCILRI